MVDELILAQAARLLEDCRTRGLRLVTAESCTGGLIAAALTAIPGSSDVVDCGFVTYSNAAKTEMLGVPAELIASVGAVSDAVAARMAEGALARSAADIAVSVTGVAGPGGGSVEKPVGLVWFGIAARQRHTQTMRLLFPGDRTDIRRRSVVLALQIMQDTAQQSPG